MTTHEGDPEYRDRSEGAHQQDQPVDLCSALRTYLAGKEVALQHQVAGTTVELVKTSPLDRAGVDEVLRQATIHAGIRVVLNEVEGIVDAYCPPKATDLTKS